MGRIPIEIFFFHPSQKRLPGYLPWVRVTFEQLPLDEFLDRLGHTDVHKRIVPQLEACNNAKAFRATGLEFYTNQGKMVSLWVE